MLRKENVVLTALSILAVAAASACTCGSLLVPFLPSDPACRDAPYSNPPASFAESDLVGTWQTTYHEIGVDQLEIKGDGTFKQVYEERLAYILTLYRYETPSNRWWLERFPDGRVRLHLEGARYYYRGERFAELEGMGFGTDPLPWLFDDPFAHEYLEMVGELVLNVRTDRSGEVLLHHMFISGDEGFAMIGCREQYFRRLGAP